MNLQEYECFVVDMAPQNMMENQKTQLNLAMLGMAGEVGEATEHVKKFLFHDRPLDKEKFTKELSDVLWYLTLAVKAVDSSLQEVIDVNVKKLRARYPSGKFTIEEALMKKDVVNEK